MGDLRRAWWLAVAVALFAAGCGSGTSPSVADAGDGGLDASTPGDGGQGDSGTVCAPDAGTVIVDCSNGSCADLVVDGGEPTTAAQYGLADPGLFEDPLQPGRIWLAHSFPEGQFAPNPDGGSTGVPVYTVGSKLAVSDDSGGSFAFAASLWPAIPYTHPTTGAKGFLNSESYSITSGPLDAGVPSWFSVRIAYFLQPIAGYAPDWTSWTLRVATATDPSPISLATAPEAVLGEASTPAAWNVQTNLASLSPDLAGCFVWNNPDVAYLDGRLFLVTECVQLASNGQRDPSKSFLAVFSTSASGAPTTWTWRYEGSLGGAALATELGAAILQQPDLSTDADGKLLLTVTPAAVDSTKASGLAANGGITLELASLSPPQVKRDCTGAPVIRARMDLAAAGSFTFSPHSATGLVYTEDLPVPAGSPTKFQLHQTLVGP